MEEKLRFETASVALRDRPLEKYGPALLAIALFAIVLVVFQLFFRYEYIKTGSALLRIDRITRETCRIDAASLSCPGKSPSVSTSLSTSTSTSTSTAKQNRPGR